MTENQIPMDFRDRAKRRSGTKEWNEHMQQSVAADKQRSAANIALLQGSRRFDDLLEAIQYAASQERRGKGPFVLTPWSGEEDLYYVLSNEDAEAYGTNLCFLAYRCVLDEGEAGHLLAELTDTIEEV